MEDCKSGDCPKGRGPQSALTEGKNTSIDETSKVQENVVDIC